MLGNRSKLPVVLAMVGLMTMLAPTSAYPSGGGNNNTVTTTVIGLVSGCLGFSCTCPVFGNLKAIYKVQMNSNGTASVNIQFKPLDINGNCANVTGHGSAWALATVGASTSVYSPTLTFNYTNNTFAAAVTTFIVNPNGTVSVQSLGIALGSFGGGGPHIGGG